MSLSDALGQFLIISFGVFLFILFFQPFPLDMLDYNNRLLYVTGFWAITFLLACIIFIILPLSIPKWFKIEEWESGPPFVLSLIFLVIIATSFAFYINYVGKVSLSFYIVFKVILVCLLPLLILIILYKYRSMKQIIGTLQDQNKYYISKIGEYEKTGEEEEIDIISDSKSEKLTLKYKNIISVKSADNYIEIYYLEKDVVEKKLVRNTLKNIELQLANQRIFIRCHRTGIANINYINKLARTYSGYSLKMRFLDETIPVSRQYLKQVKNVISVG